MNNYTTAGGGQAKQASWDILGYSREVGTLMKSTSLAALFVVLTLWGAAIARAQTLSQLNGTVTDNANAVIVGAGVTVRHAATGVANTVTTNEVGAYRFLNLPPGQYELTCEFKGFKRFQRAGLTLETGIARTVDIQMQVGDVTESVVVKAETPMLEASNSTVGQLIERATVFNMPVESRRSASLVRLMGAVVFNVEDASAEQIPRFSMAGGRSVNQMWMLDGGIAQNMAIGQPQLSLNPPAESLQEFKAETNNYSAEFGRTGNGLIIMTTRSGTNDLHGAAYEFLRNDKLDSRTFFAPRKPPLRYNVFGASAGGPVKRDKAFFFFNYEGARRRTPVTFSDVIVPHPNEIRGDFSPRQDVTILDPLSRQPFAGNVIPASRIDPLAAKFAAFWPAPNTASDNTRAPRNNYIANGSDSLSQNYYTAKVDYNINDKDRISGRYSDVRAPETQASIYPNQFADYRGARFENRHANAVANWFRNFSPSLVNEARLMFGDRLFKFMPYSIGSKKNGELGVAGVNPDGFATIGIAGVSQLGNSGHGRYQTPIRTMQITDVLTWVKGRHSIKTGFDFRYTLNKDDNLGTEGGRFDFNDRATNNGLAAFLLGWTTNAALARPDIIESRMDYYGSFVQDDWKVTSKLTINLGLRWEMDTPRFERNNRAGWFDSSVKNPGSGNLGALVFAGRDGIPKWNHDFDANNFGPRVGFAYSAAKGVVVRGGYGVAYNGIYYGAVVVSATNGFGLNGSFTSPDGGITQAFPFQNGMPAVPPPQQTPGFGAVPIGSAPRTSPDFFQKNHVASYAQQWNLTVQKELIGNSLIEVAYLANVGHKLPLPSVNLNMIPLVGGRGPAQQSQFLRPYPQYNNVVQNSPPWGNSTYHALNLKYEKRYAAGLSFLGNYTWSKFIDDVAAINELGGAPSQFTHVDLRRMNRSLAGNHVGQRLIFSSVYDLPLGKGRRVPIGNGVADAILGGWGIGAIVEFRDGTPYGVVEQTDRSNTFAASNRPLLVRSPALSAGRPRGEQLVQYFDVTAFAQPAVTEFGNAPRYMQSGPGVINVDASVNKRWAIGERYGILFRGDFYNLPNRPNFANPNGVRGRGDFGRITSILSGSTGRRIQFSLRFEF